MRGEEKWGPRKKITRVLKKQGMLEAKGSFLKIEPEKAQGYISGQECWEWDHSGKETSCSGKSGGQSTGNY